MQNKAKIAIASRLKWLSDHVGGVAKLAKIANVRDSTMRSAVHRGGLTIDTACAIIRATECSPNWLLTGDGDPFPRPIIPHDLTIVSADRNHRYAIGHEPTNYSNAADLYVLPVLKDAAAAGPGRVIHEADIEGPGVIHRSWCPHPDQTDYIRIKGASMEPTIPDGALVTIDRTYTDIKTNIGKIVAIATASGEVTIKRLIKTETGKLIGQPDNRNELNTTVILADEDRIIGRVLTIHTKVQ